LARFKLNWPQEAAAIYTLKNLNPHGLEVGDTFVLCDAGGGTVDLISYSITGLFPELQVKEASPGTGGFCGSTYLDESFSNYLTRKLSNEPGWDSDVLADAMSQFNTVIIGYIYCPVKCLQDIDQAPVLHHVVIGRWVQHLLTRSLE
jgi:hypothetical protein